MPHDKPNGTLWKDMINALLTWTIYRRPCEEKDRLLMLAVSIQEGDERKREVREMIKTIADSIHEEGERKAIQEILLIQGEHRFGVPDEPTRHAICAINDLTRLKALSQRILTAKSWSDLFEKAINNLA
jgi:hypothetical protein